MTVSNNELYIGNLQKPKEPWLYYKLNKHKYESVLDASMISDKNNNFELLMACKVEKLNQIHLFNALSHTKGGQFIIMQSANHFENNLTEEQKNNPFIRVINFHNDSVKNQKVAINQISKKLLLANGEEKTIYEWSRDKDDDGFVYSTELQIGDDRVIQYIIKDYSSLKSGFHILTSKQFDSQMWLYRTETKE